MELTYRYLTPSRLDAGGLTLATSGGFTPSGQVANPYFFSGFMRHPDVVGAGLLEVARLARTRFYTPPTIGRGGEPTGALDPVVTVQMRACVLSLSVPAVGSMRAWTLTGPPWMPPIWGWG